MENNNSSSFITDKEFENIINNSDFGKELRDSFGNNQMKIGISDFNINSGFWDYERRFLNWFLWTKLYIESWVFRNAIDKKSEATVSEIEIESIADPVEIDRVIALYMKYRTELSYLLKQSAIYGGAASLMLIEGFIDEDLMMEELDISNIPKGAKMSLYTRDRWNGLQWEGRAGFEALGTSDFRDFKYYKFNLQNDEQSSGTHLKAHYSFVLKGRNRKSTTYTQYQLSGWDMPEGQHIYTELLRDETTRGSAVSLISKSLLEVVKMAGIRGLFSGISGNSGQDNTGAKQEVESRIAGIANYRNFNNIAFLDQDDEYEQFEFNGFTGLADMLIQQKKFTAGATEIPELILYGSMETKGLLFMSDGKLSPEIEVYQQMLNNRQDYILRPIMDKMLPVLWRIANGTDMPEGTTYTFLPVFKESQTAKLKRAETLTNTIVKAYETGIISQKVAAQELKQHSKQTGVYTNISDEYINKLNEEPLSLEEIKAIANRGEDNNTDSKKEIKKQDKKIKDLKDSYNKIAAQSNRNSEDNHAQKHVNKMIFRKLDKSKDIGKGD